MIYEIYILTVYENRKQANTEKENNKTEIMANPVFCDIEISNPLNITYTVVEAITDFFLIDSKSELSY